MAVQEITRAQLERHLKGAMRKIAIGEEGYAERDEGIRQAIATKAFTWAELREITGLSDQRLNQIRRGTRQ